MLFKIDCFNEKVAYFSTVTWLMIEKYFPVQKITISSSDKEWMTVKIKDLISQKTKSSQSQKWCIKKYPSQKSETRNKKS